MYICSANNTIDLPKISGIEYKMAKSFIAKW